MPSVRKQLEELRTRAHTIASVPGEATGGDDVATRADVVELARLLAGVAAHLDGEMATTEKMRTRVFEARAEASDGPKAAAGPDLVRILDSIRRNLIIVIDEEVPGAKGDASDVVEASFQAASLYEKMKIPGMRDAVRELFEVRSIVAPLVRDVFSRKLREPLEEANVETVGGEFLAYDRTTDSANEQIEALTVRELLSIFLLEFETKDQAKRMAPGFRGGKPKREDDRALEERIAALTPRPTMADYAGDPAPVADFAWDPGAIDSDLARALGLSEPSSWQRRKLLLEIERLSAARSLDVDSNGPISPDGVLGMRAKLRDAFRIPAARPWSFEDSLREIERIHEIAREFVKTEDAEDASLAGHVAHMFRTLRAKEAQITGLVGEREEIRKYLTNLLGTEHVGDGTPLGLVEALGRRLAPAETADAVRTEYVRVLDEAAKLGLVVGVPGDGGPDHAIGAILAARQRLASHGDAYRLLAQGLREAPPASLFDLVETFSKRLAEAREVLERVALSGSAPDMAAVHAASPPSFLLLAHAIETKFKGKSDALELMRAQLRRATDALAVVRGALDTSGQ